MNSTWIIKSKAVLWVEFAIPLILIGSILQSALYSTIVSLLYLAFGIISSLKDIKNKFVLFSFNVGFFTFILGGYITSWIINRELIYFSTSYFSCSDTAVNHACFSAMLSIVTVNAFYCVFENFFPHDAGETDEFVTDFKHHHLVRQLVIVVLCISYICQILGAVETLILVRSVTYFGSQTYLSSLPAPLSHLASLFYVSLFMYWSFFPEKKGVLTSIVAYGLLELIVLAGGERGEPISAALVVIFYILLRNKHGILDVKINKKLLVILILLIPIIIYGLQTLSYTRNDNEYDATLGQGVEEFLEAQGGTVRIIARSYDIKDTIERMGGHTFVLGEIRYYLKNNVFARLITGKSARLRNIEDAYSGDNFLRTYGYAYAPTTYLKGIGGGSTYIAEVYHDGGYLLLFIINILYGLLICRIDNINVGSLLGSTILLNILRYIPLLPRGMALDWLTNTFSIQNLIIFTFLYMLSRKQIVSEQ